MNSKWPFSIELVIIVVTNGPYEMDHLKKGPLLVHVQLIIEPKVVILNFEPVNLTITNAKFLVTEVICSFGYFFECTYDTYFDMMIGLKRIEYEKPL